MNNTVVRYAEIDGFKLTLFQNRRTSEYRVLMMRSQRTDAHVLHRIRVNRICSDLSSAISLFGRLEEGRSAALARRSALAAIPAEPKAPAVVSNERIVALRELFQARRMR